jgi:hypothetical protein
VKACVATARSPVVHLGQLVGQAMKTSNDLLKLASDMVLTRFGRLAVRC